MIRTLSLLGGRVRRPPVLRAGVVRVTQSSKGATQATRRQAEMEAEKQFLRLINTAQIRRQRQIAEAIKRAVSAKYEDQVAAERDVRYAKNRKTAKAELAAVEKERALRAAQSTKPRAASPSVGKAGRLRKSRSALPASRMDKKKQAAKEERFFAALRRRVEQRNARVKAIVAKTVKLEEAKAKAKAKAESIAEASVRAKAEALRQAEATAEAEQRFEETIRRRQEERAARIKTIVERRMKAATADAKDTSAIPARKCAADLQQFEDERDARVQAIIAEHMGSADVTQGEENADTPVAVPAVAASTSRRSTCKVVGAAAALPETGEDVAISASVPHDVVPVEAEGEAPSAKKTMTSRRRHLSAATKPQKTVEVLMPASVEPVEESAATTLGMEKAKMAAQLPSSPPRLRQAVAADPEALAIAHDNFVTHLKKAKERTTAPPSTWVSPVSTATASSSRAARTWVAAENPTGLFRL